MKSSKIVVTRDIHFKVGPFFSYV